MLKTLVWLAIAGLLTTVTTYAAEQGRKVVIYDGVPTEVAAPSEASRDLWVTLKDLTRATRFVVKPQGICRDELCFPIPKSKKAEFISRRGSVSWFNLSEFARLVKQPGAPDEKNGVWYFGKREDERGAYLASLEAPNFTLPDMSGRTHSLSDYRGKKVLLITWASW
jgi:AhpC/TSA family protein